MEEIGINSRGPVFAGELDDIRVSFRFFVENFIMNGGLVPPIEEIKKKITLTDLQLVAMDIGEENPFFLINKRREPGKAWMVKTTVADECMRRKIQMYRDLQGHAAIASRLFKK